MPRSKNIRSIKSREEAEIFVPVLEPVQDFLASTQIKALDAGTQSNYKTILTIFAEWCSHHSLQQNRADRSWQAIKADTKHPPIELSQINDHVVTLYLAHIKETHQPNRSDRQELSTYTLANYGRCIKRFLNWCLLDEQYREHVKYDKVQRIQKPRVEEAIKETFNDRQIKALFDACEKEESEHLRLRDKAILSLLLDTGIRATELCTLTIEHAYLDANDPHIKIFGKGKKWGEVGMGKSCVAVVRKYIRQFREPTIEYAHASELSGLPVREANQLKKQIIGKSVLFVARAGQPLTKYGLYKIVQRLGSWAGVPDDLAHPHTFRHTFARKFIENGGDIYKLSKLLRHTSVRTTEIYLKSLKQSEARRGAKSVLDNM